MRFYGQIRITGLKVSDICFSNDLRLAYFESPARAGCAIRQAKTGRGQVFLLRDSEIIERLKHCISSMASRHAPVSLFASSSAPLQRRAFYALNILGVGQLGYTLHSLRHGVATYDRIKGMSFAYVMQERR